MNQCCKALRLHSETNVQIGKTQKQPSKLVQEHDDDEESWKKNQVTGGLSCDCTMWKKLGVPFFRSRGFTSSIMV